MLFVLVANCTVSNNLFEMYFALVLLDSFLSSHDLNEKRLVFGVRFGGC